MAALLQCEEQLFVSFELCFHVVLSGETSFCPWTSEPFFHPELVPLWSEILFDLVCLC